MGKMGQKGGFGWRFACGQWSWMTRCRRKWWGVCGKTSRPGGGRGWSGRKTGILRRALEEQYHWRGALPPMAWTEGGKPFFPQEPAVHFSLSHTPGGVLAGLSAAPIGVDLERTRPVHPRLLARTGCTGAEDFMAGWVRREARAKRLGTPVELGAAVAGGGLSGLPCLRLLYGVRRAPAFPAASGGYLLIKRKTGRNFPAGSNYVYTILRRRSGGSCRASPAK